MINSKKKIIKKDGAATASGDGEGGGVKVSPLIHSSPESGQKTQNGCERDHHHRGTLGDSLLALNDPVLKRSQQQGGSSDSRGSEWRGNGRKEAGGWGTEEAG